LLWTARHNRSIVRAYCPAAQLSIAVFQVRDGAALSDERLTERSMHPLVLPEIVMPAIDAARPAADRNPSGLVHAEAAGPIERAAGRVAGARPRGGSQAISLMIALWSRLTALKELDDIALLTSR
jgi:hypothetical protein